MKRACKWFFISGIWLLLAACGGVQGAAPTPTPALEPCPTSANPADVETCPIPGLESDSPAVELTAYQNPGFGLSLQYPAEYTAGGACAFEETNPGDGTLTLRLGKQTTVQVSPADSGSDADSALDTWLAQNPDGGLSVLSRAAVSLGQAEAVQATYRSAGSLTAKGELISAVYGGNFYLLRTAPGETCPGEGDILSSVQLGAQP
jgi:hypothetical protein